jgi:PAS domain S-box-containing protein
MVAAAGFNGILVIYAWRRRSVPGAIPFAFMATMLVPFVIGAAMVLATVDASGKIFWTKFQLLWLLPTLTAELCFLLEYANLDRWLTRRTLALLTIPCILAAVLFVTNNAHHAVWASFTVAEYVHPVHAWAGWIFVGYGYMVALASSAIVCWLFSRSPMHRAPAAVYLLGQVAPRVAFLLEGNHVNPVAPMNFTAIAATFTVAMFAVALFGLGMFDLLLVAHGTMIEQMQEGVVVLDCQRQIVDLNPAASRILGLPGAPTRGMDVTRILPESAVLTAQLANSEIAQSKISIGVNGNARRYALSASSLKTRQGPQLGYLILLHDVTEQDRAQQRLMERQRALATLQERDRIGRELHDNLSQVLGFVKMQAQAARALNAQGQTSQADAYLNRLASVAQDAHMDVREYIIGACMGVDVECDFFTTLESYLRRFGQSYGITTELRVVPELTDEVLAPMVRAQLLRIIQEALTNVRKHAQTREARVNLHVNSRHAEVRVEDDGVGFDPEFALINADQKFGLHFMQERAAEVGGSVRIQSAPGKGTQVIVDVPLERNWHESDAS